jgi:hypothetical protein
MDTVARKPNRLQALLWLALLIVFLILSLRRHDANQVGSWFDDAHYVTLARSLLQSDQFGLINEPGDEPGDPWYPFAFPLLLAPFVAVFPGNLDALKLLSMIATAANAALLFWGWPLFSPRSHWWGLGVTALYLLSPTTLTLSQMVMSEAVFMTACLVAMLGAERAVRGRQGRWWSLFMGILLTFALFARTLGVALVLAVFVYLLVRTGKALWRPLLQTVVVMIAATALVLALTPVQVSGLLPVRYLHQQDAAFLVSLGGLLPAVDTGELPSAIYLEEEETPTGGKRLDANKFFGRLLPKLRQNLLLDLRYAVVPAGGGASEQALVERLGFPSLSLIAGAAVLALLALGSVRWLVKDGLSVMLVFALFHGAALLLWRWIGTRLLYPIQPQLYLAFLLGLEAILVWMGSLLKSRNARRAVDIILAATVILMLLLSLGKGLTVADSRLRKGDLAQRTSWLRDHAAPDAILMSEAPIQDYLYGGHRTVPHPRSVASAQELDRYMAGHGVDYVLIAPDLAEDDSRRPTLSDLSGRLLPLLSELVSEGRAVLVYESDEDLIQLFEVHP